MNVPNLLSLSRLPLTGVLCAAIAGRLWWLALAAFALAAVTDWLDGWWARRFRQQSRLGRSLDPLTDKVLTGCAFIFLQSAETVIAPWMTAVIIGREIWVTGLRGMVEATGASFGADWFGKTKTFLQMVALLVILLEQCWPHDGWTYIVLILLYSALAATIGSGVQYTIKAARILARSPL